MIVSEARLAANRANAQKSTGPKTDEGKERSRSNSYKHGMTGAGVVLDGEDAAAVERRFAGFQEVYHPETEAGRGLVRRAALLSVRLERSAVQEAAAISAKIRAAGPDFDEAREAEVDQLFRDLAEAPAGSVRCLLRMPEGVDRMARTWRALREDLTAGDGSRWGGDHALMAIRLTGRDPGGFGVPRAEALARAFAGDPSLLAADDGAGLDPEGRREWARAGLAALIDAEVAKLEAHRATLDLGAIAADRARAADRALFDPSKAAELARKYEAAAERGMYRALKEMRAIEAEAARSAPAPAPAPIPSPTPAPLGSFSPTAPARTAPAPPAPAPAPIPARIAPEAASTYIPMAIGRPGPGRS